MSAFQIARSTPEDLDFVCWLFEQAIVYQRSKGYLSYKEVDRSSIKSDIARGENFKVMAGNEIACTFSLTQEDEFIWKDQPKRVAIYSHKATVNPKYRGKRILGTVIDFIKDHTRPLAIPLIRMDTWARSPSLIAYYESFGFKQRGHVQVSHEEHVPLNTRGNLVVLMELEIG